MIGSPKYVENYYLLCQQICNIPYDSYELSYKIF